MRFQRSLALAVALAASAGLGACGSDDAASTTSTTGGAPAATSAPAGASFPLTVDSCGIDLEFTKAPTKAVTLQQGATEIMLSLGLEGSMAGTANLIGEIPEELRAAYDSVPVLTEPGGISREAVLDASPDFFYSTYGSIFVADQIGTREELVELGINPYLSNMDCQNSSVKPEIATFEGIFEEYRDIAAIFGVPERAEELITEQQAKVDEAKAATKSLKGSPSVLWFYSTYNGTPYVAGANGIPGAISKLTNTTNVFSDVTDSNWPEVSWEAIAKADPDIIVLADLSERGRPGDSADEKKAMLKADPATANLTAVKNDQFIVVSGVPLDPSSRTIGVLDAYIEGLRTLGKLA